MATLGALGAETGKFLSHANNTVFLQNGVQGTGEVWIIESQPNNLVALACSGAETGKFLSHANNSVFLQNGVQGAGEEWQIGN